MLNPLERNGHSFPYYLDESTFNFKGVKGNFCFLFNVSMIFSASHLGLFCLHMSHKKDALRIRNVVRLVVYHSSGYTHYLSQ